MRLKALIAGLNEIGLKPGIVTGGGTGTHWIDSRLGLFTELQVGSFVFLDSCYGPVPVTGDGNPYSPSLFVAAAVVTANRPDRVIVNAGYKALATDSGKAVPMRGIAQGATYRFMGDEHGAIERDGGAPMPELGSVIELLTPHCDPTVNLHAPLCRGARRGRHRRMADRRQGILIRAQLVMSGKAGIHLPRPCGEGLRVGVALNSQNPQPEICIGLRPRKFRPPHKGG